MILSNRGNNYYFIKIAVTYKIRTQRTVFLMSIDSHDSSKPYLLRFYIKIQSYRTVNRLTKVYVIETS